MKQTIKAILLLVALAGWMFFPPPKTVASQTETKTEQVTPSINEPSNIEQPISTVAHNANISRMGIVKSKSQTETGIYNGRDYSKEEIVELIKDYSTRYGISADLPLRIAACESGYNSDSKNNTSSASGVFQYLASTWKHTEAGKAGISVFDADANVHMAIKSIASGGISNWTASKSCWSK